MANEKNLISKEDRTPSERRENARKAGVASGCSRRAKKTTQVVLSNALDAKISKYPQFAELAASMGLDDKDTVKALFTLSCLFNSMRNGNLDTLEKLINLLGESVEQEKTDVQEDDPLTLSFKEEAERMDNGIIS